MSEHGMKPSEPDCGSRRRGRCAAFTLVELLVVVAVIALLVSILMPVLARARELASIAYCQSNLRTLYLSASLYAEDNTDEYPPYTMLGKGGGDWTPAPTVNCSMWLLDDYTGARLNQHYPMTNKGLLPSNREPTPSPYFCTEFPRYLNTSVYVYGAMGLGYAVNWNYVLCYHCRPSGQPPHNIGPPKQKRSEIPQPDFTIFMRELNPPDRVDVYMDGPGLWPLNRMSGRPSPYPKYGRMHAGGQNVLWFGGRVAFYAYPTPVPCQLNEKVNYTNYAGNSLWPP